MLAVALVATITLVRRMAVTMADGEVGMLVATIHLVRRMGVTMADGEVGTLVAVVDGRP